MSNPDGEQPLRLEWMAGRYAVCRLDADAPIPQWAMQMDQASPLCSITRSDRELSIVCDEALVPEGVRAERGFVALRVVGTLDFNLTGIIARLTAPLAAAGVSVFVVSTFETDYLLIKATDRDAAVGVLPMLIRPSDG